MDEVFRRLREIFNDSAWRDDSYDEALQLINDTYARGASLDRIYDEISECDYYPELVELQWPDEVPSLGEVLYQIHFESDVIEYTGASGVRLVVPRLSAPTIFVCPGCNTDFELTSSSQHTLIQNSTGGYVARNVCEACFSSRTVFVRMPESARFYDPVTDLQAQGLLTSNGLMRVLGPEEISVPTAPRSAVATHLVAMKTRQPLLRMGAYSQSPFEVIAYTFLHVGTAPKNGRYYGVELEVEARNSHRDMVAGMAKLIWPFGIITSDASLERGCEIKTLPATLEAHRVIWKTFFEGKPNKWATSWSSGRCGMHVHVSASSIGHLTLGKLNVFYNTTENRRLIELVAGREITGNEYCKPNTHATKVTSAWSAARTAKHYEKVKRKYFETHNPITFSHHNAFVGRELNGKATYELRIFRGNLAPAGFFKNLEFTDAVICFCEETPIARVDAEQFLHWLRDPVNLARYRYLGAFLSAKKALPLVPGRTIYLGEEVGHGD